MDKVYSRIVWQNQPSNATALGATNLNKMDYAINELDNRVVAHDINKADLTVVNNLVQSITFNDTTGVMTITKQNGTSTQIDTKLEKLAVNFSYNPDTQQLVITLDDGTTQNIDLSSLITQYEFADTDTIAFTLENGVIKAIIINGSITDEKMQPNYLADITVQAQTATTNANSSKRYAVGGVEEGDAVDNAKYYKEQAQLYKNQAQAIVGVDIATNTVAGLVKGGGNVSIGADGTLNVDAVDELLVSDTELVSAVNENTSNIISLQKHRKGSINVAELSNCLGDGVNFDDAAFQWAVDNYKVVFVPETDAYYRFEHDVNITKRTTIIGLGLPHIRNDTANAENVFSVMGTDSNRVSKFKLKDVKISNGTASEGAPTSGKNGIVVDYCDKFTMSGCYITEIQGEFGLSTRHTTDIDVSHDNTFYRCTYANFMVMPECENVTVEHNVFDTCTSSTASNTYLFATGGDATIDGYACKNLWVRNNKFLNNPRWEGIDTHGVENAWIENNYIENVQCGIMAGLSLGFVSNPAHKNITIRGNTVKQGTGNSGSYGIYAAGAYNSSYYILAENVTVENNTVIGFGSTTSSTVGSIHLQSTKNAKVIHNSVSLFKGHGIMANINNKKMTISDNDVFNPAATDNISVSLGITVRSNGNDVDIYKNRVYSDNANYPIKYGMGMFNNYSRVNASDNYILADNRYYNGGYFNVECAVAPSVIYSIKGDYATNANDMRAYYCTDAVMRFNSGVPSSITVTGTSGSNILTIAGGSFLNVLPGLEVVITGGGTAGANLTTTVIDVTNTTITLKNNLATSVTGAVLSYTNATWVAA